MAAPISGLVWVVADTTLGRCRAIEVRDAF
jgi:hypothetical protein